MSYVIDFKTVIPVMMIPITKHFYTDCAADFDVQTDYKDSDLPYFHLSGAYSPIQSMHYN